MPKYLWPFLLAVILLFLCACSTVSVKTDFDPATSFAQYRAYNLLAPSNETIGLSPSGEKALRETLRNSLATHGVMETDENADLHIVRHISVKDKLHVYQSGAGVPYRYGRYGAWAGAPYGYTDVSQYTEGTLILDFVDAKTQKLVFRGIASATVTDSVTNAARIKEAVQKIMQDYPHPDQVK
ncbi:MAG: DUF4136 domain-containing protein [Methylicorpusculum sp.]|uniref:DUF4136 domain-containing protein n=1 Tax=Methylicorpusculum sp. TaxID=2713644 RepID=UPI0027315713|nr:DUF4136 domain-containing protein [Methylicorpusculum sp.]MDP2203943.1 DUF4136 domain-containing protein [Methylicorpusculum sp.]